MDSPRWCEACKAYGDHHTDRHPSDTSPTAQGLASLPTSALGTGDYQVVPEQRIAQLEAELACARKDYERAQRRTFELSEHIAEVRAEAAPLRDLLRAVAVHCIPKFCEMHGDSMDQIWQDVRKATT